MEVHRSQEASNPEQSSQRWILLKGRTSRITLLLLFLVSLSLIPVILSNHPLCVICINIVPQKVWPSRRNQYHDAHISDGGIKHSNNTTTARRSNKLSQGQRIIMPLRGTRASSSGKSKAQTTPSVGASKTATKTSVKLTAAERSAEAEAKKEQQLTDILEKPRFDPMGDGNFSTSESSLGWVPGGEHDSDWTTDNEDDDEKGDNGLAKTAPIRRWETTLRKVDEDKLEGNKTEKSPAPGVFVGKTAFFSPQRKEGSEVKRAQPHTPVEHNRLRDVQTRNLLATPESLIKMRINATVTKHGETLDSHIKAFNQIANPYNTSATGKIHFGSNEIRFFDDQNDDIHYPHFDDMEDTEDEKSIDCPPTIGRTTVNDAPVDLGVGIYRDQLVDASGLVLRDRQAVEVGGGGDCLFYAVADQAVCDRTYAPALRAATAKYLLENKNYFDQCQMIVGDELEAVTVEEYAARVSITGEYAGEVEMTVLSTIMNRRITVYDRHRDPRKTRVIGTNNGSLKENYEVEYDNITQHYRSIHGPQWKERNDRLRINLKDFQVKAMTFLDLHFTSSGRHVDGDGTTCGAADFKRMIISQGGTYSNTFTSETNVLIVGTYTRKSKVEHAKCKGIAVVPYSLLCARINWEITTDLMMTLGRYVAPAPPQFTGPSQNQREAEGVAVDVHPIRHSTLPPSGHVVPVVTTAKSPGLEGQQTPLSPVKQDQSERRETEDLATKRPFRFSPPVGDASTPRPLFQSAIKNSRIQESIPINQTALNRIHEPEGFSPKYNSRPANVNRTESFISISFTHDNDEEYRAATSIRERAGKIFRLIFLLDKSATLNPAYNEQQPPPSISAEQDLPDSWQEFQKYIYISNHQSLGPGYVKDGVRQTQGATFATARITTSYDISHLLSLLALDLADMNTRMFLKPLAVLSSRSVAAIIGTQVDWNLPAMTEYLTTGLREMLERRHTEGCWENKPEFHNRDPPLFSLRLQKMKASKPREGTTAEEREFEEYYHNLRQIITIECPDEDKEWLITTLECARSDGLIKSMVSRFATWILLPSQTTTSGEDAHFEKSFRKQMILVATNSLSTILEVSIMQAAVRVEMDDEGYSLKYKFTDLKRELTSLRMGLTSDGKEGARYIDGAQFVTSGNGQGGGKVLIMHSNNEEVVTMVSNLISNPVAYIYWYLRKINHFSHRCAMKAVTTWFIYPNRMADSKFNPVTNTVTSRARTSHTIFDSDMKEANCLEIPDFIRNEMAIRTKAKAQEPALQRLTEMFDIKPNQQSTDFSNINSVASALTTTSHTTNGNPSCRSVNTEVVNRHLDSKREERCHLMMRLRELDPDNSIFQEEGYDDDDKDYLSDSSENTISQAILYRATRGQITKLNTLINQVESENGHLMVIDNSMGAHASTASEEAPTGTPPPSRGSATPTGPAARSSKSESLGGGVQGS